MPTITEALQSSWHVHCMWNKHRKCICGLMSQSVRYSLSHVKREIDGLGSDNPLSRRGPATCRNCRLCLDMLHVLRFFVVCRCGVPVRLYTHIHCSGNVLSSINA